MIRLIEPYISFLDVENDFKKIFESGTFTKGYYVDILVKKLCEYTGASYAHLTTSATTALYVCLKLVGIKPGDEVLVSDFSFPATANVVEELYAKPIFVDVDLNTFNMDPDDLEKKITSKTKAVIFVDALGNPSGIHNIKEICHDKKLVLIEDAACALGSSEKGVKCGSISDLTCFSFHPRKIITSGEGGAILTNNKEWSEWLNVKLSHGAVFNTHNGKYDFIDFGYNFRLSEFQAAMLVRQLEMIDDIVVSRREIRNKFRQLIEIYGFTSQYEFKEVIHNIQSMVFKVPEGISRDELINFLRLNGIESTLGTYSLSACTYYKRKYNNIQNNSLYLQNNTITFPCHNNVNLEYMNDVIDKFIKRKI